MRSLATHGSVQARPASPFAAILEPRLSVVTVARPLPAGVTQALGRLARSARFEFATRIDSQRPDPSPLLGAIAPGLARNFLAADIAALAREFGRTLGRKHVHARLAVVRGDACRKLHADSVTVRMLCTYVGRGTEWVADADVVRRNLAREDVDVETANRSVLRRPGALRACEAGDVILLKGDAFPGNRGRGAVHRSPAIEARGLTRLVLKIDEHPCGC